MPTKIVKNRKAAVAKAKAKGVSAATARKRNYVRTRAAEMKAKGMKADKAALRKKFDSGEVKRKGFYAKGEGARKRKAAAAGRGNKNDTGGGTPPETPAVVVKPPTKPDLPGGAPATRTGASRPSRYGDPGTMPRNGRSRVTRNPRGT